MCTSFRNLQTFEHSNIQPIHRFKFGWHMDIWQNLVDPTHWQRRICYVLEPSKPKWSTFIATAPTSPATKLPFALPDPQFSLGAPLSWSAALFLRFWICTLGCQFMECMECAWTRNCVKHLAAKERHKDLCWQSANRLYPWQVASWIGIIDCPKSGYTRPNKQPRISPSKGCHRGSGASALRTEWVFSAAEEDSTTDLRRSVQRNSMEKLPLRNIALEMLKMITMFSQPQKYVGSRLHHSNNYHLSD